MALLAAALLLLQQLPDTIPRVYDAPATEALVQRAIAASAAVPPELRDYRATVQSGMYTSIAPDSATAADLPASVDETVSTVRWQRGGALHQTVQGHRARLLIPLPYTLATILQGPWVIPHLYGSTLYTPFAGRRAVNPFGMRGPEFYRYAAEDPVRLRVQGELVTLVPVSVRPRVEPDEETALVVGTFYLDAERGAVARARFGFSNPGGDLPRTLGQTETFLELENGLWEGRYWLPFQQRREVVFASRLLGGSVAARVVNRFVDYELNTGWEPTGRRLQLTWSAEGGEALPGWDGRVGEEAGEYSIRDFDDLRVATATADPDARGPRLQLHYDRGSHLFRYNRVEGPYLGVGARLIPPDPRRERWEVYATAGWAFAEATPRGELRGRWGATVAADPLAAGPDWGAEAAVYRRLRDIQPFRPTFEWEFIYTLPAVLWGSDTRDYYDAAGAEAFATARLGRWSGRLGGRWEQQDSVSVNTGRYLFGEADEFGPLAGVEPGTHAAVEAGGGYALGPGAFGVGSSLIARAEVEQGLADFRFTRLTGLLSARRALGPLTLAGRLDAGRVLGGAPPQKLFRFGSLEGLRGYEPNEFGGSSALLARSRLLVGLPPRSSRPLARFDFFLVPPLRPALVLLGETGWTGVDDDLRDELLRLGSVTTDGWRSSVGVGLSLFDDAITIERLFPVGDDADQREARWYVGLAYWY